MSSRAAAYNGVAGIDAGRVFLNPVREEATIPFPSEVSGSISAICGVGGGTAGGNANSVNQGVVVNGVYNLSVYEDVINNQNTHQFEIVVCVRGSQAVQIPFALTVGNQSLAVFDSNNNAINTLDAFDSLVDVSTADVDCPVINLSGKRPLQGATIQNIADICFDLYGVTANNFLLARSKVDGIIATCVNSFSAAGLLVAGNSLILDAVGTGA